MKEFFAAMGAIVIVLLVFVGILALSAAWRLWGLGEGDDQ